MLDGSRLGAAVGASGEFIDSPVAAGMRFFFDRSMRAAMTDEQWVDSQGNRDDADWATRFEKTFGFNPFAKN